MIQRFTFTFKPNAIRVAKKRVLMRQFFEDTHYASNQRPLNSASLSSDTLQIFYNTEKPNNKPHQAFVLSGFRPASLESDLAAAPNQNRFKTVELYLNSPKAKGIRKGIDFVEKTIQLPEPTRRRAVKQTKKSKAAKKTTA